MGDELTNDTKIVTGTSNQEVGSPQDLMKKITGFAEAVHAGTMAQPDPFFKSFFESALNSQFMQDWGNNAKMLQMNITEEENLSALRTFTAAIAERAKDAEVTGLQSVVVAPTGNIESNRHATNGDGLVMKIDENLAGPKGRDNYVNIYFFWGNRERLTPPKQGKGQELSKELDLLKTRLTSDPEAKLLRATVAFVSRPKAPLPKI